MLHHRPRGLMALMATLWVSLLARPAMALPTPHGHMTERIYGGNAVGVCTWPSVVMVETEDGLCSGSLVNPNIVVYAAHCNTNVQTIYFGEDIGQLSSNAFDVTHPARTVTPSRCAVYPGHDPVNGTDFAYCLLSTPVTDVPIVPILMGCEAAALTANKTVVLVGFGMDESGEVGTKRTVTTALQEIISDKSFLGGGGKDTCFGDSGGPAYVQLTSTDTLVGKGDNSWRVFGITSYGVSSECGGGSFDTLMYMGVPWIESDSGIDITPCTDANGTWQPGPDCGHFPLHADASIGAWAQGCSGGGVSAYSGTCGPAYGSDAPTIVVTTPVAQSSVSANKQLVVGFTAQDAAGHPPATVTVTYDGTTLAAASGSAPPKYQYGPVTTSSGDHMLVITATDATGASTTQQVPISATEATGGCQAAPTSRLAWVLLLAGILARRRVKIHRATGLAVVLGLSIGCGGTQLTLQVGDPNTVVHSTAPSMQSPPVKATGAIEQPVASITGTVVGMSLVPQSVTYLYGEDGNQTVLYIVLSSEKDACGLIQNYSDTQTDISLTLELASVGHNVDEPLNGTFTVISPNAIINSSGDYALVQFTANDKLCNNALAQDQAFASAGQITLTTYKTPVGSYIAGTLTRVVMGSQQDMISGTFTASDCNLDANPDLTSADPFLCR